MSQRQRLLLSIAAVAIVVMAFIALRPDDDEKATQPAQITTERVPSAAVQTPASTTAEPPPPAPAPRPTYVQIRAKGLRPVGGVKKIKVNKGDTVRFEIRSDRADEGHLHGYDISKDVGPGKRARYKFEAKLEGIFEIELEHAAVPIAELQVNP